MYSNFEEMASEFKVLVNNRIDLLKEMNEEHKRKMEILYKTELALIPEEILDMPFDDYLIRVENGDIKNHLKLTYFEGLTSNNKIHMTTSSESLEDEKSNSNTNMDCALNENSSKTPRTIIKRNDAISIGKRLPKLNELMFSENQSPIQFNPMDIFTRMNVEDIDFENMEIPTVALLQKKFNTLGMKAERTIRAKKIRSKTKTHRKN